MLPCTNIRHTIDHPIYGHNKLRQLGLGCKNPDVY